MYGTVRIMSYSMMGMSAMFGFIGHVFILVDAVGLDYCKTYFIASMLVCMHLFLGAFFSIVSTGYYSLATLIFADTQSAAISSIETASGIGYIIGPILGSMLYDSLGYRCTYSIVSLCMLVLAFVTRICLATHLQYEAPSETMSIEEEEGKEEEEDNLEDEELGRVTKKQCRGVSYQHMSCI
jgi:MFS family permease